jgi:hypothetical protein
MQRGLGGFPHERLHQEGRIFDSYVIKIDLNFIYARGLFVLIEWVGVRIELKLLYLAQRS